MLLKAVTGKIMTIIFGRGMTMKNIFTEWVKL